MIRAMRGLRLIEKTSDQELMDLEETLGRAAKANGMRSYGHVLGRNNDDVLGRGLDFEVVREKSVGDRR